MIIAAQNPIEASWQKWLCLEGEEGKNLSGEGDAHLVKLEMNWERSLIHDLCSIPLLPSFHLDSQWDVWWWGLLFMLILFVFPLQCLTPHSVSRQLSVIVLNHLRRRGSWRNHKFYTHLSLILTLCFIVKQHFLIWQTCFPYPEGKSAGTKLRPW